MPLIGAGASLRVTMLRLNTLLPPSLSRAFCFYLLNMGIDVHSTTIVHAVRKLLKISTLEYCFLDTAMKLANSKKARTPGWCSEPKESLAKEFRITRSGVYRMIKRLEAKGLMERNEEGEIRSSKKWYDSFVGGSVMVGQYEAPVKYEMGEAKDGCFVYLMFDSSRGYYKIGRANNVQNRLKQLKTANATIEVVCYYPAKTKDEVALHEMFKGVNVSREWFRLEGEHIMQFHSYFLPKFNN
jgi:Meiotically up-regulated gene 113